MQRNGQEHLSTSGSKSMACNESNSVNVGGPVPSHMESKYQLTSIKARKLR